MKAIVVGMGVQGTKRKKSLRNDFICSVDNFKKSNYKSIKKVPLNIYDTVFVCVPDEEKVKIIKYSLRNKKNVLVEKPFITNKQNDLIELQRLAKKNNLTLYTAYNHRFEPNILKLKKLIDKKLLGKIYSCKISYGNGTSKLVKKSKWRDKGLGVVTDLGSHLIDLCIFWFGKDLKKVDILELNKFENKSPDQATISCEIKNIKIILEMSLCMWKNTFSCDVIGSKGSAHLDSLCKWSKNEFIYRKRKIPAGKPIESKFFFKRKDPTWGRELNFFKKLISKKKNLNFERDLIINREFLKLKKS